MKYFNDEWNQEEQTSETTRGSTNSPRVAPCSAHAYASEEQEEILKKEKT